MEILNHNHESITPECMLKEINGFLITIQNKKLKNPE